MAGESRRVIANNSILDEFRFSKDTRIGQYAEDTNPLLEDSMAYSSKTIVYGIAGIMALGAAPALAHHEMNELEAKHARWYEERYGGSYHCELKATDGGQFYMVCQREGVMEIDTPIG